MSVDAAEDEAAVDVRVPTRRRRASDDEAEDAEFHDAAEYAASVSSHPEEHTVVELPAADEGRANDGEPTGEAEGDEQLTGADEQPVDEDQAEEAVVEPKKAKLREPFEVPTTGAFWLHDDRFGEEDKAGPSRPTQTRKNKSDTDERWLHDKFSMLEFEGDTGYNTPQDAFGSHWGRSGRGMRGGRRGGGPPLGGRGRGGRSGRGYGAADADGQAQEDADATAPEGEALPQRRPRAPRVATRDAAAPAPASSYSGDQTFEPTSSGAGRGRGRGGEGRGAGRGRGERSYGPEGGEPGYSGVAAAEANGGRGYGRGAGGRGAGRAGRGYGRDEYDSGTVEGGGRGRGRGRGPPLGDSYERTDGYGRGSAPGRGSGRGDSFGRGAGPGRGASAGRGPPPQQQRGQPRSLEEEFPPLPGAKPPAATAAAVVTDAGAGAAGTGGVRRYSKMAGKVAGGGDGGAAPPAAEGGRTRADANRASKLSAAAPTFEPTPAAPAVPSVPVAFGAPLQPLTAVPALQPAAPQPPVTTVPDAYGAPLQSHAQYAPPMQHQQPQQPPFQPPMQPPMQGYAPPMQQPMQQPGGTGAPPPHQQAPPPPMQQQQQPYGGQNAGPGYGSYNDMESWFQDAYQKALATGMDPQQAYSAVQGYVQGMQMAFQTLAAAQQRGGYPAMPQQGPPQAMPQGQ